MNKKITSICKICGEVIFNDEKHRCKYNDLKKELIRYQNMHKIQFNTLSEAQEFIKNNTWNINDKEQIKNLLLIIWNSITNQKFKIKIDLGDDK